MFVRSLIHTRTHRRTHTHLHEPTHTQSHAGIHMLPLTIFITLITCMYLHFIHLSHVPQRIKFFSAESLSWNTTWIYNTAELQMKIVRVSYSHFFLILYKITGCYYLLAVLDWIHPDSCNELLKSQLFECFIVSKHTYRHAQLPIFCTFRTPFDLYDSLIGRAIFTKSMRFRFILVTPENSLFKVLVTLMQAYSRRICGYEVRCWSS